MSPRDFILLGCAVLSVISIARICILLGWRKPVLARRLGTDYGEMERARDSDFRRAAMFDGQFTADDLWWRRITIRAEYSWQGALYREDVHVFVEKGWRPDSHYTLWIDPNRPTKVTSIGLGFWTMALVLLALLAFAAWYLPIGLPAAPPTP